MNDLQRPPNQPTKVTLEDLLRLKRAERPPVEFWADFERQMRTKQLAAIVRKDPWWRSWRNVLAGFSRFHLPLGATAMFALAFITVREYRHVSPAEAGRPSTALAKPSEPLRPVAEETHASTEVASADTEAPQLSSAAVAQPTTLDLNTSVEIAHSDASPSAQRNEESSGTPEMIGFSAGADSSSKSTLSGSSRAMAAHLAVSESDEPELLPVLARSRNFDASLQEKSSSVEPLSQISTPRDTRRARLLASAVPTDLHSPEHSPARSRERITSQLSEQSLYDSITRLGLAGNRLSIKF
jgi:hypothetical protein